MKAKKIPQRMCVGCMQMKEKSALLRIVKQSDGTVSLDPTGKKNGRGAYICKNISCLQKAIKAKKLEKAISMQLPDEVYSRLQKELDTLDS